MGTVSFRTLCSGAEARAARSCLCADLLLVHVRGYCSNTAPWGHPRAMVRQVFCPVVH